MKIEIAQAIASTAMSAINAYASAAVIPTIGWTLAPIAAGMATAAGMIQLAAIKSSTRQRQQVTTKVVTPEATATERKQESYMKASSWLITMPSTTHPSVQLSTSSTRRSAPTLSAR